MAAPRYEGPFVRLIGDEDLLRPTAPRIGWLVLGLLGAVVLGFLIGLALPRRRRVDDPTTAA